MQDEVFPEFSDDGVGQFLSLGVIVTGCRSVLEVYDFRVENGQSYNVSITGFVNLLEDVVLHMSKDLLVVQEIAELIPVKRETAMISGDDDVSCHGIMRFLAKQSAGCSLRFDAEKPTSVDFRNVL